MTAIWMICAVALVSISLVLAYQLGYQRGWIAGTAEALQDVYGNVGDADE